MEGTEKYTRKNSKRQALVVASNSSTYTSREQTAKLEQTEQTELEKLIGNRKDDHFIT